MVCYTNAQSAHLTLNGQPIGGEPQRDENTNILYWDIDYAPGTLLCTADNQATYEVKTTKAPKALRLTTDGGMHIFAEVVDEDGNVVKQADNEVTLRVRGGRLLGMENGNMQGGGMPFNQRNPRLRVQGGRLVAYIKAQGNGPVTVTATSPFLESDSVQIGK